MFSVRPQAAPAAPIREPLAPRELLTLLLDRGLLNREALVAGAVRIQSASRRNHNFFVENDHGPSFFVKQGISDGTAATIGREAAFYQHAPNASHELARHLPRFIAFIPDECVLVLEMVSEAASSRSARRRRITPSYFRRLGAALALLHDQTELEGVANDQRPAPLIVRLASLTPHELSTISAAGVELIRTIQGYPGYEAVLNGVYGNPPASCLTHNDLKAGNCLIGPGKVPILVDWEFVALGDPAWDIGCLLADFLSDWLLSMPLGSSGGSGGLAGAAARPIESMHPSIYAFWTGYCDAVTAPDEDPTTLLVRATRCAGLRLSQSAFEMCQGSPSLTAVELFFLQTSWNVMERPLEAIVHLLGLRLGGPRFAEQRLGVLGA
jgi:thiamine kinase-like enzyme